MTTDATSRGPLLLWSATGRFIAAHGNRGPGPGEFADRGELSLVIGSHDTLYVRDGTNRITVFDPAFGFVRAFQNPVRRWVPNTAHRLDDGRLLLTVAAATGSGSASRNFFRVLGPDGRIVGEFAPITEANLVASGPVERLSAYSGGTSFWVAASSAARQPLTLEEWSTDGTLLRRLERHPSWLPPGGYPSGIDASEPQLPNYARVTVDDLGLLWLVTRVRSSQWRAVRERNRDATMRSRIYQTRIEVIDPLSGVLLASTTAPYITREAIRPAMFMFPGTRRSYVPVTDSVGLVSLEMYELTLTERQ